VTNRLIDLIATTMQERDISRAELARMSGLSKTSISRILNGKQNNLTQETIDKLLKSLNINRDTINREESISMFRQSHDVSRLIPKMIKIVGTVRAGVPLLVTENFEGEIMVDARSLSPGKAHYAVRVNGDSMDREFTEGTVLVVEKVDMVESGDIAIVGINGDEATVKMVQFHDNSIVLIPMSNNPKYLPEVKDFKKDDIHIFGRVIQAIKQYRA